MKILVINGPNVNLLGLREPKIYGSQNYDMLIKFINNCASELNIDVEYFQSNHEGKIIDKIQQAYGIFDGILINPAAYTHTSIAILDALKAINLPTVEVHISQIRELAIFQVASFQGNFGHFTLFKPGHKANAAFSNFLIDYINTKR